MIESMTLFNFNHENYKKAYELYDGMVPHANEVIETANDIYSILERDIKHTEYETRWHH